MTNFKHETDAPTTWFITGATAGIGHAMTTAALLKGDNVVATGRDITTLKDLADAYGERLLVLKADIRDEASIAAVVLAAVEKFGRLDTVALNPAYGVFGGVEEISDEQWRAVFDVNVFGTANILRAVLPTLRAQKSGHILIASAHFGQKSRAGVSTLSASKHAIEAITDSLADEVAPLGIKVTAFAPGFTSTNFKSRLGMAANLDPDYDQTARAAVQAIDQLPAEVINTAEAVVEAVFGIVGIEAPPRRLATGGLAYSFIKESLEMRLKNLEDWSELTHSVDAHNG